MAKIITERRFSFNLSENKKKERIDVYLANSIENASRNRVQYLIEMGYVTVNGKITKSNYKVNPLDNIEVVIPCSPRPEFAEPEDIPLDVPYEDDYLLIVNKPAGMVAHPSFGHYEGTLVNALLHHTNRLSSFNDPKVRPGIVHRIDKDTSGLLVVAKDEYVHAKLSEQFAKHTVDREYWTIAWGKFKEREGRIVTNIGRSTKDRKKFTICDDSQGKLAITNYKVETEFEFASLVKMRLETGRTHQIRVHLSGTGHPIFGDVMYGGDVIVYGSQLPKMKSRVDNLLKIMPRQALHAKVLGFEHPITKERIYFESDLPEDFTLLMKELEY